MNARNDKPAVTARAPRIGSRPARRIAALAATAIATAAFVVIAQNILVDSRVADFPRFTTDFSPTYLQREIATLHTRPPDAIFLGDSVLWGFGLRADQTAITLLNANGCICSNLSFKAGNPANYYALARLLRAADVKSPLAFVEVNQKVLNAADDSYATLHPAVATVAGPLLDKTDRAMLQLPRNDTSLPARADTVLSRVSTLYAMRADVRESLFGSKTPDPIHRPRPDELAGSYDLTPLSDDNVGVHFLEETVALLHEENYRIVAFLTPTNHGLLHDYIDNDQYRANLAFLTKALEQRGAHVVNLDAAFPSNQFFDFNHLTAAGQQNLAGTLRRYIVATSIANQNPR